MKSIVDLGMGVCRALTPHRSPTVSGAAPTDRQEPAAPSDVPKQENEEVAQVYRDIHEFAGDAVFTGYAHYSHEVTVTGIVAGAAILAEAELGQAVELITDYTPFSPASDTQAADRGEIRLSDGARVEITDARTPKPGLTVHSAVVREGRVATGDSGVARINVEHRRAIARSHSAAHLLIWALHQALGHDVAQISARSGADEMTCSFTAVEPVNSELFAALEDEINRVVLADRPVAAYEGVTEGSTHIDFSCPTAALNPERVVVIGEYGRSRCAGVHVARTANIGLFRLRGAGAQQRGARPAAGERAQLEAVVGSRAMTEVFVQLRSAALSSVGAKAK